MEQGAPFIIALNCCTSTKRRYSHMVTSCASEFMCTRCVLDEVNPGVGSGYGRDVGHPLFYDAEEVMEGGRI
ncbi:hypothetical protein C0J52_27933 [Blattella germanica]|nr:hypothetical protein C0J52_27933 [Blattella germanica]